MSAVCLKGWRTDREMIQVWHGIILVVCRVYEWRLMSMAYLRCCTQVLHAAWEGLCVCVAVIKTEIWLCAPAQRWQSLPAGERGAQGEQVMKTGRLSSIRAPFLTKCSQHHNRILILLILLFLSCSLSLAYNNTQLHSFGRGENKRLWQAANKQCCYLSPNSF